MLNEWLNQFKPTKSNQSEMSLLDIHLAQFLTEKMALDDPLLNKQFSFLIMLLSRKVRAGDVCLDLTTINDYKMDNEQWQSLDELQIDDWQPLLRLAIERDLISDGSHVTPLILINHRLYFQRMWFDERQVARFFNGNDRQCLQQNRANNISQSTVRNPLLDEMKDDQASHKNSDNLSQLKSIIDSLFTPVIDADGSAEIDWQKVAVAVALTSPIAIISGGPGTGKTTTVAKILAATLLLKPKTRIVTAAPTGKAASRLTESLTAAIAKLDLNGIEMRNEAITLHRLLGAKADNSTFIFNRHNPLHLDLLIIDEASMVDLNMMARVLDALPRSAQLILLGDKDQLSSVEAGAVFGDLCTLIKSGYSDLRAEMLTKLTGFQIPAGQKMGEGNHLQTGSTLADNLCLLRKSYRFNDRSGIGRLATMVRMGNVSQAKTLLKSTEFEDIHYYALPHAFQTLLSSSVNHYKKYLQAIDLSGNSDLEQIAQILAAFSKYRLLCAVREGPYGVVGLNRAIELQLAKHKLIALTENWYVGRPVMILQNSSALGLFNGDIGIALPAENRSDPANVSTKNGVNSSQDQVNRKLRVYFPFSDGTIRGFSPYRLPEHETAYVMTVHKSQGSEFNHVNIVLPNEYTPILNRSLLYTAITRAKKSAAIYATDTILSQTIKNETERESGLVELLQGSVSYYRSP